MRTVRLIIKWSLFLSILTTVGCEKPKALYTLKPWNENVAQPDAAPELAVKMQAAIFKDPSLFRDIVCVSVCPSEMALLF